MRVAETLTRPLDSISVGVSAGVVEEFERGRYFGSIGEMVPVPNGIDIEAHATEVAAADGGWVRREHGIGDLPLYLNVGRLASKKRQRDLVDAAAELREDEPEFHLVIIGAGTLEAELRARVRDNDVDDIVTITGRVESVAPYFAAADVYVHAALYEGFGLTIAEAMAAGLPVVCTDVPGARDVVGDAGVRVPPKTPAALAEAMELFSDEYQRQVYAERSKKQVQQFDIQTTVDRYCEYYFELA
jgi:glycosyltransferase involved in cell wall biosynthesis